MISKFSVTYTQICGPKGAQTVSEKAGHELKAHLIAL